jgi:chromosome segregation ATPase
MSEESEKISLEFIGEQLKRVLSGQTEIKEDLKDVKQDLGDLKNRMSRLESTVEETALAVANLAVSNRHIRADVSKVLANQEQHEARIKRIEEHLGLTDA